MATVRFYTATDVRQLNLHSLFTAATKATLTQGAPDVWRLRDGRLPQPFEVIDYTGTGLQKSLSGAPIGGTASVTAQTPESLEIIAGTVKTITQYSQTIDGDLILNALERSYIGLTINAVDWYDAHLTATNSDDLALLRAELAGNDRFILSGGDDFIWAMGGNDTVSGRNGDDTVYGGNGADSLLAEDGADLIFAGAGADRAYGGLGNDRLDGEDDNDRLWGGAGNDQQFGGTGADWLYGEDGRDLLSGGSAADQIFGGASNDTLIGGSGNDTLSLGAGVDVLRIAAGFGTDTVTDFTPGVDHIEIHVPSGSTVTPNVNYQGGNATVTVLDGTLILLDVAPGSITSDSFILVPF